MWCGVEWCGVVWGTNENVRSSHGEAEAAGNTAERREQSGESREERAERRERKERKKGSGKRECTKRKLNANTPPPLTDRKDVLYERGEPYGVLVRQLAQSADAQRPHE